MDEEPKRSYLHAFLHFTDEISLEQGDWVSQVINSRLQVMLVFAIALLVPAPSRISLCMFWGRHLKEWWKSRLSCRDVLGPDRTGSGT